MRACMLSLFSRVQLFVILWTVAYQDPPSMGFSRQEYWNRLPCPPSGDLPNLEIKPASPVSPALAGRFFTTEPPGKNLLYSSGWPTHAQRKEADLLPILGSEL